MVPNALLNLAYGTVRALVIFDGGPSRTPQWTTSIFCHFFGLVFVIREKATEVLFETLATPAMHMALQPVLALYACGPSSGLVVDIGDSGTQVRDENRRVEK